MHANTARLSIMRVIPNLNWSVIGMILFVIAFFALVPMAFKFATIAVAVMAIYFLIRYDIVPWWKRYTKERERHANCLQMEEAPRRSEEVPAHTKHQVNWSHIRRVLAMLAVLIASNFVFYGGLYGLGALVASWL